MQILIQTSPNTSCETYSVGLLGPCGGDHPNEKAKGLEQARHNPILLATYSYMPHFPWPEPHPRPQWLTLPAQASPVKGPKTIQKRQNTLGLSIRDQ